MCLCVSTVCCGVLSKCEFRLISKGGFRSLSQRSDLRAGFVTVQATKEPSDLNLGGLKKKKTLAGRLNEGADCRGLATGVSIKLGVGGGGGGGGDQASMGVVTGATGVNLFFNQSMAHISKASSRCATLGWGSKTKNTRLCSPQGANVIN